MSTVIAPPATNSPSFAYAPARLREIAQEVLDCAHKLGATACATDVSEGVGLSVSVRCGEVETIEHNRDKGLGVIVYLGQRQGHASTADFSAAALSATVEAALAIARHTSVDDCAGLAEPHLLANSVADPQLFYPWSLTVEEAIEQARACEAAAFSVSPLIDNSEGATVSAQQAQFVSANSLGFMGGFASSCHSVACAPIARRNDDMQRDDWYSSARDAHDLESLTAIGETAARRALARLSAKKLTTRRARVLFEAPLACGLIGSYTHLVSGGALYRKTSFLVDSLGQRVFPEFVHIDEDPFLPKGLASSPFDDDGVATGARRVVDGGVVAGYFLSVYTARKLKMQTSGNAGGCHNLLVRPSPGERDFKAMLQALDCGLLVTELLGHGINYVTGDYSRGAVGFWVEHGEIQYPVHEITIAGNLRQMFAGIEAIGNDTVIRRSKRCGSILLREMTIAGS